MEMYGGTLQGKSKLADERFELTNRHLLRKHSRLPSHNPGVKCSLGGARVGIANLIILDRISPSSNRPPYSIDSLNPNFGSVLSSVTTSHSDECPQR